MLLKKGSERDTRFMLFTGKGGVGKTSISAATALWLARQGKKTLIISTDPAHSLADSFGTKIGGEVKKLESNLYAVEIDPKASMQEYREMLSPQLEKLGPLKGLDIDKGIEMAGMTPGIDELASFDRFLRHMTSREYDVIAFDTAPTGHTLRLLSLPDILDSWVGKLIRLRMRLSSITGAFKRLLSAGEEDEEDSALEHLEALKKRIEQAKAILTDPDRTEYNIVMIPEAMSIYETQRSVCFLKDICIPVHSLIVNQIIPENSHCEFCKEKRKLQLGRLAEIRKEFPKKEIHELHLFKDEVRGKKMLEKVARELYG